MLSKFVCAITALALIPVSVQAGGVDLSSKIAIEMQWHELGPGLEMTPLWQDSNGDNAMLLRMAPGFVGIDHGHSVPYHGVAISGIWVHIDADGVEHTLTPGSFAYQEEMAIHSDQCRSEEPCVILIHLDGVYDFFLPE